MTDLILPAPLQPSDVNLQGMEYMPLYIERLRRSRAFALAASEPAAGFSMRLLWEESWFALPAGSLEDDDLLLAAAARCSRDEWKVRRPISLYGWALCSDGRLYHPVICQIAWATWQERLKARHKNACDRIKLGNKRAIEDAQRQQPRLHVEVRPIPTYEAWVRQEYPVTAAKLFAAAAPAAAADSAAVTVKATEPNGGAGHVAATLPLVEATPPPCRGDTDLKREGEGKIPPQTPPLPEAATGPEAGKEWQRAEDFAAYLEAVGQPDAPLETCWRAWLDAVQELPERRVLLARVAAWRAHGDEQNAGRKQKIRPLGPARLLREGTLNSFAEQAEKHLASHDQVQGDLAVHAREAWGELFDQLVGLFGGAVFLAWFGDERPEREGDMLIIHTRRPFRRNWITNHYADRIARALGCAVEVRLTVEQGAKA